MTTNKVVVLALDKRYKKFEKDLTAEVYKILGFLQQEGVKVEVYLIGSLLMRHLNRQYHGRDKPTNILSFSAPRGFIQPPDEPRSLGEIYLCPSYVQRQGEAVINLLIHGLLHLIGFKHATKSDRITMRKMESQITDFIRQQK